MPQHPAKLRLSQEQTRALLDDYMQYRFRQSCSPEDLAKKAGVKRETTTRLMQQQPVNDGELTRVAHALGVSAKLLREICGLEEMPADMLETLQHFMAQTLKPKARERGAH